MARTRRTTGQEADRTVVVHGEGIRVDRGRGELPIDEVRSRFGGLDPLAVLAGVATALGTLVVLSALLGAVGVAGGGQVDREALSIAGLVAGVLALGLSLLFGGYVAGRVARYSGLLNGLLTAAAFVILTAVLSALAASAGGERYGLPEWLDRDTATTAAVITALTALVVCLLAGALGGRLGGRWHRQVDQTLLGTRDGGLGPYPAEPTAGGAADQRSSERKGARR